MMDGHGPDMRRRMLRPEEDAWSDYQLHHGHSPGLGISLSVLPNRRIGPSVNASPSRHRGKTNFILKASRCDILYKLVKICTPL